MGSFLNIFSLLFARKRLSRITVLLSSVFLIAIISTNTVFAANVTSIRVTNDPRTGFYGIWGQSTVLEFTGGGGNVTLNGMYGCPVSSSPAQCGGWSNTILNSSSGTRFTVTPGGASCTVAKQDGYSYCGVAPYTPPPPPDPDRDDDGILNESDACPDVAGPASNDGCPRPPQSPDPDNDGVEGNNDDCPRRPGPASNRGCPVQAANGTVDSDGDGFADNADSCPNQAGIAEYNGCPAPTPVPAPLEPREDIACNVSAAHADNVRVRERATTDSAVIWTLDYSVNRFIVIAVSQESDGTWYRVSINDSLSGWVRSDVVQIGGIGCEQYTVGNSGGGEEESSIPTTIELPVEPPANENAARIDGLTAFYRQTMQTQCPLVLQALAQALDTLLNTSPDSASSFANKVNPSDPCASARGLLYTGNTPGPVDAEDVVRCVSGISSQRLSEIIALGESLGIQLDASNANDCLAIYNLAALGILRANQRELFDALLRCGIEARGSLNLLVYAVIKNVDIAKILNHPNLCTSPRQLMDDTGNHVANPPMDERLERAYAICPEQVLLFLNWVNDENSFDEATFERILSSEDVCLAIRWFLVYGKAPERPPVPALPPAPPASDDPQRIIYPEPEPIEPIESTIEVPSDVVPQSEGGQATVEQPPLYGLFSNSFDANLGYFSASSEDGDSTDIYRVAQGDYIAVLKNTPEDEFAPAYQSALGWLSFMQEDADGTLSIAILTSMVSNEKLVFPAPFGYRFVADSRIVWHPYERAFWVTVESTGSNPTRQIRLYRQLENSSEIAFDPILYVENAQNPSLVGGYLVFERLEGSQRSLQRINVGDADLGNIISIQAQPQGLDCHSASEWDSERLLFVCDSSIYLGSVLSGTQIVQIDTQLELLQNPMRVPLTEKSITFDDSVQIFFVSTDPPNSVNSYLQAGPVTRDLVWVIH